MAVTWTLLSALTIVATTLPNGLSLFGVVRPEAPYAVASLWVRSGSAADPVGREGTAHLLEHLLPLQPFDGKTVQMAMERKGTLLLPETGRDFMAFHLLAPLSPLPSVSRPIIPSSPVPRPSPQNLLDAFSLMATMLQDLRVDERVVAREKALMRLELLGLHEEPFWVMKTLLEARVMSGTPFAHPPSGWLSTLETLTLDDARQFFRCHFRAANCALIAVVPDEGTLTALGERATRFPFPNGAASLATVADKSVRHEETLLPFLQRALTRHNEAFWGMGWRLEVAPHEKVAADALVIYLQQTLAPSVLGTMGVVQEWNLVANPVRNGLLLSVVARLRPTTEEPERRWRQALRHLAEKGVPEEEIRKVKWHLRWQYTRALADPLQCVRHLGWAWALHDTPHLLERYEELVNDLAPVHLQELVVRLLQSEPVSVMLQSL